MNISLQLCFLLHLYSLLVSSFSRLQQFTHCFYFSFLLLISISLSLPLPPFHVSYWCLNYAWKFMNHMHTRINISFLKQAFSSLPLPLSLSFSIALLLIHHLHRQWWTFLATQSVNCNWGSLFQGITLQNLMGHGTFHLHHVASLRNFLSPFLLLHHHSTYLSKTKKKLSTRSFIEH